MSLKEDMRKEDLVKHIESRFSDRLKNTKSSKNPHKQITEQDQIKTGTTTVGITCKDAVILGTDKRASMQYFVSSKRAKKLHKIQEHLYMTIAGSVADAQNLVDVLRAETSLYQYEKEKKVRIEAAGKILANILFQNKMTPYQVGLILGGVTEKEGAKLLNIGAYGSILPDKYCAVGSGQNFSYGVLEAKYKDDLSIEEGKNIVIRAVKSSIVRDMASGNGIDIAVVKKDSPAEREFISIKEK
ncbi:MAG: archaeal proteasome endopeptidase complex subunit beta [Promethearchaeia archaeon]